MKASKKLSRVGGNYYFPLTKDMREYLGINEENFEVEWQDDVGRHGRFISLWKKQKN